MLEISSAAMRGKVAWTADRRRCRRVTRRHASGPILASGQGKVPRSRRVTATVTDRRARRWPRFPRGKRPPAGAPGAGSRRVTGAHAPTSGPSFPQSLPRLPRASRRVTPAPAPPSRPASAAGTGPAERAPPAGSARAPPRAAAPPAARAASSGIPSRTSSAASPSSPPARTGSRTRYIEGALSLVLSPWPPFSGMPPFRASLSATSEHRRERASQIAAGNGTGVPEARRRPGRGSPYPSPSPVTTLSLTHQDGSGSNSVMEQHPSAAAQNDGVVSWSPVSPVEVVPISSGGDTSASVA